MTSGFTAPMAKKIKKTVELQEDSAPLAIISEQHWQKALFG